MRPASSTPARSAKLPMHPAISSAIPNYIEMRETILSQFKPSTERPQFDIPRFWSNPALQDPDRIICLVLAKPTIEDLARTVHSYGPDRVIANLTKMIDDGELEDRRVAPTVDMLRLVLRGVADAALELAAA